MAAWFAVNDCRDIEVIGIDRAVVAAFGTKSRLHEWGTTELRRDHGSVARAVTEVVTRVPHMQIA